MRFRSKRRHHKKKSYRSWSTRIANQGRASIHTKVEGALVALDEAKDLVVEVEAGVPDQGAVAEYPEHHPAASCLCDVPATNENRVIKFTVPIPNPNHGATARTLRQCPRRSQSLTPQTPTWQPTKREQTLAPASIRGDTKSGRRRITRPLALPPPTQS